MGSVPQRPVGQDSLTAVPVTESPDFVTLYFTLAPLWQWKVSVAGSPSRRDLSVSVVRMIVLFG